MIMQLAIFTFLTIFSLLQSPISIGAILWEPRE